jgi:cellulose biosynthesis protein BcsQ
MEQVENSFKSKEPKIISLIQNKGGSFRTSLAFAIAKNFLRNNRIVRCYDWDQQQNLQKMLPEITQSGRGVQVSDLETIEADYIINDTPPTIDNSSIMLMLKSDSVLVPFHLSRFDVEQATSLLETAKAMGVSHKTKLILIHSGKHTNMYKNLKPFVEELCSDYDVEVICELSRNQAVPQGLLQGKTIFEINSPPSVREEYKTLFKQVGKSLVQ